MAVYVNIYSMQQRSNPLKPFTIF